MSEEIDFSMLDRSCCERHANSQACDCNRGPVFRTNRTDLIRSLQLENAKLRAKVQAANAMRMVLARVNPESRQQDMQITEVINNYDRS